MGLYALAQEKDVAAHMTTGGQAGWTLTFWLYNFVTDRCMLQVSL